MKNIFDEPGTYINIINKISVPKEKRKQFTGRSIAVVWLTKFCQANCRHCFNRSNMLRNSRIDELFQLSDAGIEKLLAFVEKARISYLLISGGGEPMRNRKAVNKIVRLARAERIVIITNGSWASKREDAERYIGELWDSCKARETEAQIVLRLSADEYHLESIGQQAYLNIIDIFRKQYCTEKNFTLMLHTLQGDGTVKKLAGSLDGSFHVSRRYNIPDNDKVLKIMPGYGELKVDSLCIAVGIARLFYPDLFADLEDDTGRLDKALDVFDIDMMKSELDNPSVVKNQDGTYGLDFWIDYNGNVTTWGNQLADNLMNLYVDPCEKILNKTQENIYSYNLLDKGFSYRADLISQVNQKAVLRAKAINLRNYTNIYLLFEKKTKLYLGVRILKDYLQEEKISVEDIRRWSERLADFAALEPEEINAYYEKSSYDILSQYLAEKEQLHRSDWDVLFTMLEKNQFDYDRAHLDTAFEWYRSRYGEELSGLSKYADISVSHEFYDMAKQRLFPVKEEALDYFAGQKGNQELVLSDREIKSQIQRGRLVITARYDQYPFRMEQIQPGSLDLRFGNRIRCFRSGMPSFDTRELRNVKDYQKEQTYNEEEPIVLKPHQIVIGETYEFVTLPGDLSGFLTGRSRYVRAGITVQPMFINPGFSGPVPVLVQNHNEFEIVLYPFADICQIVFYKLGQPPERDYLQRDYKPWRENYYESYPAGIASGTDAEISAQETEKLQEEMTKAYYANIQRVKRQEAMQHTFCDNETGESLTEISSPVKISSAEQEKTAAAPGKGMPRKEILLIEISRIRGYASDEYTKLDYKYLVKGLSAAEEYCKKGDVEAAERELSKAGRAILDMAVLAECPAILECLAGNKNIGSI